MKIHYAIVAGLLLLSPVATADETKTILNPKLEQVPRELLDESFVSYSACIGIDTAGLVKLEQIVRAEADEPSSTHKDNAGKIQDDAEQLLASLRAFIEADYGIMETLVKWHNGDKDDLGKKAMETAQTARDEMIEHIKDVADFAEFREKFEPVMKRCERITEDLAKKIKSAMEAISVRQ